MKLLILGGTVFLGRHLVDAALARGHEVTLFNRGQHSPELFPDVEKLRGDRDGGLAALEGRTWDAVIDPSGYLPRVVRASAELLAGAVGHYTFISSISVYADMSAPGVTEDAPVGVLEDGRSELVAEHYGPLKALCEQAVEAALPGRALIIRPGLIVGPHDPTNRFTYWPARVARGGDVLAPGDGTLPVQVIDGRDLAEWTLDLVEAGTTGVLHVTGPAEPLTIRRLLDECERTVGDDARFVWVDEAFLEEQGVGPWMELPLWLPATTGMGGMAAVNIDRALAHGLRLRPLAETIRDTLAWDRERPADAPRPAGLAPERERELLDLWRSHAAESAAAHADS